MKKTPHKPRSQPTRCAIYARTATEKQASEDNSIARQVATCQRFAKRKGWIVRKECIFTDSGKSGLRANLGLKDLLRIAAINPKSFDVLLCTGIDRIARDTALAIRVHSALTKHKVEIRFAEHDVPKHPFSSGFVTYHGVGPPTEFSGERLKQRLYRDARKSFHFLLSEE